MASRLREEVQAQRASGNAVEAARALRQLRRLTELKPNEHRQLFRALRRTGKVGLLRRYLSFLQRADPAASNWTRVCLAFWSEGELDWLYWWASEHPDGLEAASKVLLTLIRVSRKFGEEEVGSAIQARIDEWAGSGFRPDIPWNRPSRDSESRSDSRPPVEDVPDRAPRDPSQRRGLERQVRRLVEKGDLPAAQVLVEACDDPVVALRLRVATLKGLYASRQYQAQLDATLDLFDRLWPFDDTDAAIAAQVVVAGRLLVRRGIVAHVRAHPPERWLDSRSAPAAPLACWAKAMVLASSMRRQEALEELNRALAIQAHCPISGLDLKAEIGGLHMQYNHLGQAREAFSGAVTARLGDQEATAHLVAQVTELCGPAELYPECLVDLIFDDLRQNGPIGYEPVAGHLATVTGTFAPGGGERQTANVIAAMAAHGDIRQQTVLVASVAGENGFFLPTVADTGAEVVVYAESWRDHSDMDRVLPELIARPRLRKALGLLPGRHREEILRVTRLLIDHRPSVVHIRQDLTLVGLACALAGVPRFLIHRGSLARNTWDHTPLQADTILRPMRHLYRRLLEDTPCLLVNNSTAGLESDRAWIDLSAPEKFHVAPNTVDFERLGPVTGESQGLRKRLGIKSSDRVVGGVFRLVAVKRPLLWIQAACRVLEALPDTHLIIVGDDGEFGPAVRDYARDKGLSDRLHMPGTVQDVGEWYQAFDVLLLTSDREGLPNVAIEAQHFGVPVVTADVGGAAETIRDGVTGCLVPGSADAEAFAESLRWVLDNEAWRSSAAAAAPGFVHEKFDRLQVVDRLVGLYGLVG